MYQTIFDQHIILIKGVLRMQKISPGQIAFVLLMAVLLMFVLPMLQSKTGKSLSQILFGSFKKKGSGPDPVPTKEPRLRNGSRDDLTVFLSKLIRSAKKRGMQVVAPASVSYKGKKSRLIAFLVHKSGVTGLYCLGYGGTITASDSSRSWKQHMNGRDISFPDPLAACEEQRAFIQEAMTQAGIKAELDVVTVFTNPSAVIEHRPQRIYRSNEFFNYIEQVSALGNGDLNVEETARALAKLSGIYKNGH